MKKDSIHSGDKFGRLTTIESQKKISANGKSNIIWLCECECGKQKWVYQSNLRSGGTVSCGCYKIDRNKNNISPLKQIHPRLYRIYQCMKSRCNNANFTEYENYGGRGITVCSEWNQRHGFGSFVEWALSSGYKDSLTLDRIDVNKGYSPDNCKWSSTKEQSRNKRNSKKYTYNNMTMVLTDWEDYFGYKRTYLYSRIARGMSFEESIKPPIKVKRIPDICDSDSEKAKKAKRGYTKFISRFDENLTIKTISKMVGINENCLHDWKYGRSIPNEEHMKQIADYLGVDVNYFS